MESQLEQSQKSVIALQKEIEDLKSARNEMEFKAEARVKEIQMELEGKQNEWMSLKTELEKRPTLQQMQQLKDRLKILQAVEYNAGGDEADLSTAADSVEGLLLKKNRHLEHQLTTEKRKQVHPNTVFCL